MKKDASINWRISKRDKRELMKLARKTKHKTLASFLNSVVGEITGGKK